MSAPVWRSEQRAPYQLGAVGLICPDTEEETVTHVQLADAFIHSDSQGTSAQYVRISKNNYGDTAP